MTANFPPRTSADIEAYPDADCIEGYSFYRADDPTPGDNHSPGFRWGWQDATRDRTREDDGFDNLRFAHIAAMRERERYRK